MKGIRSLLILAVLTAVCLLSSCARAYYDYSEWSSRFIEPKHECVITPLTASLELITDQRVVHTGEYDIIPGVGNVEVYKSMAMAKAVKEYSGDILIAPLFEIETISYGEKLRITVSGYPAKYVNFRDIEPTDNYFFVGGIQTQTTNGVVVESVKSTKKEK